MIFANFVTVEVKTKAIVLRTVRYGESRLIVDLLTEKVGRLSFGCSLSKSNKGRIKKQLFQPLTILEVVFDYRERLQLQRFRDLRISTPFVSIPFDSAKLAITLFLAEFLNFSTRDERNNQPLYAFIEKSLLWLDSVQQAFANFHLVFMMHLTLFVGFYPNLEGYKEGAWFDLRDGSFSLACPHHPDYLFPKEAMRISTLMRMNYDNMHLFRMSRAERNRCVEVILYYYRLHIPNFPELKSLEVLRELY